MKDMNLQNKKAVISHPLCLTRFDVQIGLLLRERHIDPSAIPQILMALGMGLITTPAAGLEWLLMHRKVEKEQLRAPVFVLGHWRSGTTLVQYLLSQDSQFGGFDPVFTFAFNFYHVLRPLFEKLTADNLSGTRPQDNMRFAPDLPLEEYMAYAFCEKESLYPVNYFPQSFQSYMNSAYWKELPKREQERRLRRYDTVLKKAQLHCDHRRLMLKSPDNTARLPLLREHYPQAKFIHIHRNPYAIIRSSLHLYETTFSMWGLQKIPDRETLEDWIIENFRRMYEVYFSCANILEPEVLCDICFEEFERDPFPILKDAYEKLGLGDFEKARPGMEAYWKQEEHYQKNRFDFPPDLIQKVNDRLGIYFNYYGYQKGVIT